MTRHHADIAGRRLSWLQAGQGQPIVLLHAFPLQAGMWRPQLESVPHGWTLIAPDLRGFGQSSGSPAVSMDDHADDLLALLRHLNIEQAVVGGLSMGGYVAFAVARLAPQRCRAFVLADTRAEPDTPDGRVVREKLQQAARAEHSVLPVWEAMGPKLLGPAAQAAGVIAPQLKALALDNDPAGVVDGLEALKTRPDSCPTLPAITAPTLVIVGHDDALTPVANSETIRQGVRHGTLAVLPDAGHLSNVEQPEAFNRVLWDFVQALPPRA